mmetsp:Transcript_40066/g.100259  ORF Transcript_40066/g.100259 Transcript_40066/m.100259 type:complete len:405 (+) Transcript_40066:165-1379(+)
MAPPIDGPQHRCRDRFPHEAIATSPRSNVPEPPPKQSLNHLRDRACQASPHFTSVQHRCQDLTLGEKVCKASPPGDRRRLVHPQVLDAALALRLAVGVGTRLAVAAVPLEVVEAQGALILVRGLRANVRVQPAAPHAVLPGTKLVLAVSIHAGAPPMAPAAEPVPAHVCLVVGGDPGALGLPVLRGLEGGGGVAPVGGGGAGREGRRAHVVGGGGGRPCSRPHHRAPPALVLAPALPRPGLPLAGVARRAAPLGGGADVDEEGGLGRCRGPHGGHHGCVGGRGVPRAGLGGGVLAARGRGEQEALELEEVVVELVVVVVGAAVAVGRVVVQPAVPLPDLPRVARERGVGGGAARAAVRPGEAAAVGLSGEEVFGAGAAEAVVARPDGGGCRLAADLALPRRCAL